MLEMHPLLARGGLFVYEQFHASGKLVFLNPATQGRHRVRESDPRESYHHACPAQADANAREAKVRWLHAIGG